VTMRGMRRGLAALLVCIAGCGGGAGTEGGSYAAPPSPPLRVDPHAGRPALLAVRGDEAMLLDDRARIARLFRADDRIDICPGRRTIVSAVDFGGRVVVRGVDGKVRWSRRIPTASTDEVACLDPDGRRALLSLGIDEPKSVHLVTRRADRRILRFKGEIPLITPTQLFAEEKTGGLYVRSIPSMGIERRYPAVDWASWIAPSPDGRYAVVTAYSVGEPPESHVLLDLTTGAAQPMDSNLRVAGWLTADRLVVTVGDEVQVIDTAGQVQQRWPARTDQVIVDDGTIIAMKGRRLRVLLAGRGNTFRGGTLKRTVWLVGTVG
jgi:hypothetical protein